MAIDRAGDAVVVYLDGTTVEAAFRPAGGIFGPAQALAPDGDMPRVAMAGDGTAFATWTTQGTVSVAVAAPGGAFGPAQTLGSAFGASVSSLPAASVVANAQGDAAVVWIDGAGSIVAARRRPAAAFEAPVALAADTFRWSSPGMDAAGNLTVAWLSGQAVGGKEPIESADLRRTSDAWSSPETLLADGGFAFPRLEVGPDGTAIASIHDGPSIERSFVRRPGDAWAGPSTPITSSFGSYAVAADGRVHMFWQDPQSGRAQRRVRETDGVLGAPQAVGPIVSNNGLTASLAVLGDGTESAVWRFWNGFDTAGPLHATTVRSDGSEVTTDLADPADGTAVSFDAAIAPDGHVVVVGRSGGNRAPLVAWVNDTAWPQEPSRVPSPPAAGAPAQPVSGAATAPPPQPDRTPPVLTPSVRHRIGLSATAIRLKLATSEAAVVRVTGVVDPRGAAPRRMLRAITVTTKPGAPAVVVVPLRRELRRALQAAHGGVARLHVVAVDAARNQSPVTTVKITIGG